LHEIEELLTQRVMGMALGYEDANDAARLASDPVHKLLVSRDLWLANCYFACRTACNIVALCPRVSADRVGGR
jgi:hypothetical protein